MTEGVGRMRRGIRGGGMSFESFGKSVGRKGGRGGVRGWSWMGGVRTPSPRVALVAWRAFGG